MSLLINVQSIKPNLETLFWNDNPEHKKLLFFVMEWKTKFRNEHKILSDHHYTDEQNPLIQHYSILWKDKISQREHEEAEGNLNVKIAFIHRQQYNFENNIQIILNFSEF